MSRARAHPAAVLLPVRSIRAGLLAFFSALAFIEVGAGLVVAEAWKLQRDGGSLLSTDRWHLDQILDRLRVMEGVVAAGATATTILWSFVAVHNASQVGRGARRTAVLAMMVWVAAPAALISSRALDHGGHSRPMSAAMLMMQALVLYTPFFVTGKVADSVGAPRMPFLRWYLTVAAAFAVHHVFTGTLDLGHARAADDFGRTAMLYFVNGLIVALMAVLAAEASRGVQAAVEERAWQQRLLHDDAHQRVRAASGEHGALPPPSIPGSVPSGASLPAPSLPLRQSVVPTALAPVAVTPAPTPASSPVQEPVAAVSTPAAQAPVPATPVSMPALIDMPALVAVPALVAMPALVSVGAPHTSEAYPSGLPDQSEQIDWAPLTVLSQPDPKRPESVPVAPQFAQSAVSIVDPVSGLPSLKALMGSAPVTRDA